MKSQTLADRARDLIRAGFAGLYIETSEQTEAIRELAALAHREEWRQALWDCDKGLVLPDGGSAGSADPIAALHAALGYAAQNTSESRRTLLILENFHRYLPDPQVSQAFANVVHAGKHDGLTLIVTAPTIEIPPELSRLIVTLTHDLPDRATLQSIAEGIGTEPGDLPETPAELAAVIDAASGMTRYEAENAFSLSLALAGKITAPHIWELKAESLKKTGLLTLYRGADTFADLGGLGSLKDFGRRALAPRVDRTAQARGIMLLGVPGTGKSAYAKALGNETGRPTLMLDLGAMMGSLVGQTEANIRRALQTADAMAPCILFIDEIEKGLAGSGASGATDSGVAARLLGTLLTWMNDHTTPVFVVATSNDISAIPPEFTRAGRFNAIYFVDFPSTEEREAIWKQYLKHFGLPADAPRPADEQWTGAEIKGACEMAALLDCPVTEAAHHVIPISNTAGERITGLRKWANGRALSASRPGVFRDTAPTAVASKPPGRRVDRAERN